MPRAPPADMLRRPFEEASAADEEVIDVDVVGEGDDVLSDDSDLFAPEDRKPRHTRYDCGFIFEHLWRSRNKSGSANVWIPETIIFKNNSPTHWYFTRPLDGRIMKRNLGQEQFITPKKILEVLGGVTGEIAAVFINFREIDGHRVATTSQYFDRTSLRDFLYYNDPDRNGILQKFFSIKHQKYAPAASTNQILHTLHVTWKKGDLRSTKVVDRSHSLRIVEPYADHDVINDDDERRPYQYGTADPLQYGQMALPLQSQLSRKIREACERVAEHVRIVSDNAVRMTRMMCFVKVGQKGQLWFNYPSSVDVEDSGVDHTFDLHAALPMHHSSGSHRAVNTVNVEETSTAGAGTGPRDGASSSAHAVAIRTIQKTDHALAHRTAALFTHCAFCAETIESMRSCSITLHETLSFFSRQDVGQHFPTVKPESSPEPQTPAQRASQVWGDMRLTENDEITLPELRWKMKQLQIPPEEQAQIETGIALADNEVRGVVDFHLWSLGVSHAADSSPSAPASVSKQTLGASFSQGTSTSAGGIFTPRGVGSPSSPTYLSGRVQTPDSKEELLQLIMSGSQDINSLIHAAAAGGATKNNSIEPVIVSNLRSALPPKVFMRLTAPSALERESSEFLSRNVEVCAECHGSVKLFLARRGAEYFDEQLQRLLAPVAGTSGRQTTSYRSPRTRRPPNLIDRMWSRSMEMSGKFPALKPVGYTNAKVMRASDNDLAWSHRSKMAGVSPRSPPGKKPIRESPRTRAVRSPSEESTLLVRTGSAVKLLHEISDDELMRELGRRERLSQVSDQISHSPSRSVEDMPRSGETEILGMDPSFATKQRSLGGRFEEALDSTVEPTMSSTVGANLFQLQENALQKEQVDACQIETRSPSNFPVDALPDRHEKSDAQNIEAGHEQIQNMDTGDSAHARGFSEPDVSVDGQNQKQEKREKAKAESLVPEESSVGELALGLEPATEKMQASAMVIQNSLRCRRARVTVASMRQRHERLVEQQAMMEVLASLSEQNDKLQDTTATSPKLERKTLQLAKRQGRRDSTSTSPNATRGASSPNATCGASPLRLQKTSSHRKDVHARRNSGVSPTAVQAHAQHATVQIGRERRRSSISPVAVKSREEYSSRRRQSLAHALGEYEDEEQQEQQEQQVQQEQVKPEPEDALIKDANNKNSRKSEHAVIAAAFQDLGLELSDSD